jgi:hypothetical protein
MFESFVFAELEYILAYVITTKLFYSKAWLTEYQQAELVPQCAGH